MTRYRVAAMTFWVLRGRNTEILALMLVPLSHFLAVETKASLTVIVVSNTAQALVGNW